MCDQQMLRSACAYAQSDQSLCSLLEYSMSFTLLTEHLLEVPSLKEGCTGSSESTLVKMSNCLKSHATAHMVIQAIATWLNAKVIAHCSTRKFAYHWCILINKHIKLFLNMVRLNQNETLVC